MAKGPTFSTITAAFASASKLNANNAEITTAFSNTVSRDGSTPNTMTADFDMNSNNIINVSSLDVDTFVLGGTTVTAGVLPATVPVREFDTKVIVAATSVDTDFNFVRTAGFSAVGDGGGALYKAVGAEPSHALKVQSADSQWWEGVVPFMTPEMFGTAGDGVTNDLTKLQDMLDCTVSDTIMLGAGKTYFYETNGSVDNLTITRAMHIYTNGSTLHHKAVSGSSNHALFIKTTMGAEETWTETISAFASVLTITTSLAVGDRVFIELGEHPNDVTVAHIFLWATITANGGTSITIDNPVYKAVNGTSHKIFPVTPNEGGYIDVLRIIQEGSSATCLRLHSVRDFSVGSLIVKDGTQAIGFVEGCENINIGSISGNGRAAGGSSTSGRVITSWGSNNIHIGSIDWLSDNSEIVALFEAGMRDVHIGQVNLKRVLPGVPSSQVLRVTGTSEVTVGKFTLTSNVADRVPGLGSAGLNSLNIGDLTVNCAITGESIKDFPFAERLHYLGIHYVDKVQLYKRTFINELHSNNDLDWFYGVPRQAYARIDNTANADAVFVLYEDNVSDVILSQLTSGQWTSIVSTVSADDAIRRGTQFRIRIRGLAAKTALLETWVEYWKDPDVTELANPSPWGENSGEVTDTTDGSGDITIPHALGQEPRVAHVQMQGTTDYNPVITVKGSQNLIVRIFDAAGAAKTSTSVTVSWSASA